MNQLELNTRVANTLAVAERDLRSILLDAVRDLGGAVDVFADGMHGHIDSTIGVVTLEGQPVGNVMHLLDLIHAVEVLPNAAPAPTPVHAPVPSPLADFQPTPPKHEPYVESGGAA